MRPILFIAFYLSIALSMFTMGETKEAGRCTGSAYCTACKNCSACKYCNNGGSCGVCSNRSKTKEYHGSSGTSHSNYPTNVYKRQSTVTPKAGIVKQNVNVREKPDAASRKLATITRSDEIQILSYHGGWLKIKVKKTSLVGYVAKIYIL